jgi:hypothetical protein
VTESTAIVVPMLADIVDTVPIIVIFVLAGVWAAFLLPSVFTGRGDRPTESAREFTQVSARLSAAGSATTIEPMLTRRRVLARRRRALFLLSTLAVGTLTAAILKSSAMLLVAFIAIAGVIAWYLAMLVQIRQRREAAFVVDLREEEQQHDPQVRIVAQN